MGNELGGVDVRGAVSRDIDTDEYLKAARSKKISFGIDFLDDALIGLLPTDLCLIGAGPGIGKTALATEISKSNSMNKKKVVFIALEAEPNEIEMRLRYQIMAGLYYRDQNRNNDFHMDYRAWRFGQGIEILSKYNVECAQIFAERYCFLDTVYRTSCFDFNALQKTLEKTKHYADLVVIDHLHYFDTSGKFNENKEITDLIKNIRDLNVFYQKPIILVAHLRKDFQGLKPQLSDFMGSSNIGKQATISIMLANNEQGFDATDQTAQSIFSIVKARTGSVGVCAIKNYSIKHQGYLQGYRLARVFSKDDKQRIYPLELDKYPGWAKNAIPSNVIKIC